jgi:hypothetical protein
VQVFDVRDDDIGRQDGRANRFEDAPFEISTTGEEWPDVHDHGDEPEVFRRCYEGRSTLPQSIACYHDEDGLPRPGTAGYLQDDARVPD